MGKKALVAGATGLVGRALVELLLRDGRYDAVTVLVRNPLDIADPKLTQIVQDFERLDELSPELVSEAAIFCVLGTTIKKAKTRENFRRVDYEYPLALGKMAKRHGAEGMLIVTAMGADQRSRVFYNQVKGQVEEALRQLQLPYLRIFRPSLLLGDRQEHRLGEKIATVAARWLPKFLFGKFKPIEGRTVAQAMANVGAEPGSTQVEIIQSNVIVRLANLNG